MTRARETNFDGLVGPTHNYAGLSFGNLASGRHRGLPSSPRAAALQGIAKMRLLSTLDIPQAVLPPQPRPYGPVLASLGFEGPLPDAVKRMAADAPELLALVYSASAMWAANAATVSPSADTGDGRVHLSVANLVSNTHRSIEASRTAAVLRTVFADRRYFAVHDPLPATPAFGDEGAANHMRLTAAHGEPGTEVFVYGSTAGSVAPAGFPRRQTLLASQAVARRHQLRPGRVRFWHQQGASVDAGAFHNDVVAVANENVLLYHAEAFATADLATLDDIVAIGVDGARVSLADAVQSYLFNSQLVTVAEGSMAIIAPVEVRENDATRREVDRILADRSNPIDAVHFVDLRQSMSNGGGPACLRLRVAMTDDEMAALGGRVVLDSSLFDELERWVQRHYRTELTLEDLTDPQLALESHAALAELYGLLELGEAPA